MGKLWRRCRSRLCLAASVFVYQRRRLRKLGGAAAAAAGRPRHHAARARDVQAQTRTTRTGAWEQEAITSQYFEEWTTLAAPYSSTMIFNTARPMEVLPACPRRGHE